METSLKREREPKVNPINNSKLDIFLQPEPVLQHNHQHRPTMHAGCRRRRLPKRRRLMPNSKSRSVADIARSYASTLGGELWGQVTLEQSK